MLIECRRRAGHVKIGQRIDPKCLPKARLVITVIVEKEACLLRKISRGVGVALRREKEIEFTDVARRGKGEPADPALLFGEKALPENTSKIAAVFGY